MPDKLQLQFDDWIIYPNDGKLEHIHKTQLDPPKKFETKLPCHYGDRIAVFYNDKGLIGMVCTLCSKPVPKDVLAIYDFLLGPDRGYRYALKFR